MSDFVRAAWPVVAVLAVSGLLWFVLKLLFQRGCWRCRTPLELYRKERIPSRFALITRCERCGAWRGCIVR